MAKKEVVKIAKLQFIAGQAKPGPSLAGVGINMPEFTRQFNEQTRDRGNEPVPVEITAYKDKSFDFRLFTAPASFKILQAIKAKSGSANSKTNIIGTLTLAQLEEIAKYKLPDLNTDDYKVAMHTIAGTAKNMGVLVEGWDDVKKAKEEAKAAKLAQLKAEAKEAALKEAEKELVDSKGKEVEVKLVGEEEQSESENN
ncbi:50S ribosomal protein L11 [Mycoplasmopsis pulmonis]|uniref:Large ribosomal subunit protein uL11 n=1 Tax=Mycoplasmopsis pulmonis (strain UAB CTIP) TaxID=272635 RepID=RL11_MYCPU|nr:50S ribosomal protein L11 [Mycoplasmopsis pulmonis]Q98RJ9.2 RecName: Full=Large ribosomal subunit protein uL11; AltName: Full=50S ribosomal protein L11 [Mycoplasmopsis pulmonis UAB CTIP]VEU67802.1 50S ribosomal protein L14 [Mycoplasmopsis pulmonis]